MRFVIFSLLIMAVIRLSAQSSASADDSLFFSKTLILKLKPEFTSLQNAEGIESDVVNYYLNLAQADYFQRIYPNHQTPTQETNRNGDRLVDLSLMYDLHYQAEIPEEILIKKLELTGLFEYVEKRPRDFLLFSPNDPLLANQYYPRAVNAFAAWDVESGDSNVVVGIVDTGTDLIGEDLQDGIFYNYADPIDGIDNDNDGYTDNFFGWDLGSADNNPSATAGAHGCFTTGISSARVNNGKGIAGMGYNTRYLPVKIVDENGSLVKSYEGIVYAADHGAQIINNSWGGHKGNRYGQDIVNYATYNRNALVIGAGGNSANSLWIYPASYENAIAVAATDSSDFFWGGTSYGTSIDLAAPGSQVWSTWISNAYFPSSGTSFAAPGVAGAAALVKSHFPHLSALQLGEQVRVTADNIDTIAYNQALAGMLGSGRLNMYNALTDTTKFSIRYRNRVIEYKTMMPGDTIKFGGQFQNLLAPTSSALTATVTSLSPYLSVVNPLRTLGNMTTLATSDNYQFPFLLKIAPNTPAGTVAEIKITYSDTAYTCFEYFRFRLNPDYRDFDTNNITTSLSSYGTIGYTNGSLINGLGMFYKNSVNLLSFGGLIVGNSTGKVSSNVYGDSGYEYDFEAITTIAEQNPPILGDQHFSGSFNDHGANFTKLDIRTDYEGYALDLVEDVVFLKYKITNTGSTALSTLYISFFADFDISPSYRNKALTDNSLQLTYCWSTSGGPYLGLMLLDTVDYNIYNFDNDGSENSININDGFLDIEKYQAMETQRSIAGEVNSYGNDVSNMISAGPFNLAAGQSKTITFAIVGGDHEFGIKQAAQNAKDHFYNVASAENISKEKLAKIYPNPFTNQINIDFREALSKAVTIRINNVAGKELIKYQASAGSKSLKIDGSQLESGEYILQIIDSQGVQSQTIIKL